MLAHVSTVSLPFGVDPEASALAAALLVLGALALVSIAIQRRRVPTGDVPFVSWTGLAAGALSWGAAAVHLMVIDDHAEYLPFGVAFAGLAAFQAAWGLASLTRPTIALGRLATAAVGVNAGALTVWAISRFVGLPFGPNAGQLESMGSLDLAASAFELALVGLLLWVLTSDGERPRLNLRPGRAFGVVASVVTAVAVVTTGALASAGDHPHGSIADQLPSPGPIAQVTFPPTLDPIAPGPPATREPTKVRTPAPPPWPGAAPVPATEAPAEPSAGLPSPPPPSAATATPTTGPTARPTRTPTATPRPTRTPSATPAPVVPGVVRFGNTFDGSGEIASGDNRFGPGETAVWIADLREAAGTPELRLMIIAVLPDGREFEHWREQIPLADPSSKRLAATADLSIYVHGGAGSYRLRYYRGDELLAEGAFEFVE